MTSVSKPEPLTYSTFTGEIAVPLPMGGVEYIIDEQVQCPLMGMLLLEQPSSPFHPAWEMVINSNVETGCVEHFDEFGVPYVTCNLAVQEWCTSATYPPDLNVTEVLDVTVSYGSIPEDPVNLLMFAIVSRNAQGLWAADSPPAAVEHFDTVQPKYACTHTP